MEAEACKLQEKENEMEEGVGGEDRNMLVSEVEEEAAEEVAGRDAPLTILIPSSPPPPPPQEPGELSIDNASLIFPKLIFN